MKPGPDARTFMAGLDDFSTQKPLTLGDKDQAVEWLNKAYENKDWMLTKVHVEPWVDNIGSDPRLADLVRRMGLKP